MPTSILKQIIQIDPGICGGKPRIAGHRITVQNIVIWHEILGMDIAQIATDYNLTFSEIYSALAYYHENKFLIDQNLREDDDFILRTKSKVESKIKA